MATTFDPAVSAAVKKLQTIEKELGKIVLERKVALSVMINAVLCQQHAAFIGAPGAAKSLMVRLFTERITGAEFFEHPGMSTYTQVEEIFGAIDVAALQAGLFQRDIDGTLATAQIAILDEAFNAHAVLKTLLSALNERRFRNGKQVLPLPLMSVFIASNQIPEDKDLAALWDRMTYRVVIEYLGESGFKKLIANTTSLTVPKSTTTLDLTELELLQQSVPQVEVPASLLDNINKLRNTLNASGIIASDRRWVWSIAAIQASALMHGRPTATEDDLDVLQHILWDVPEHRKDIAKLVAAVSNPILEAATSLYDQAQGAYNDLMSKRTSTDKAAVLKLVQDTAQALSRIDQDMKKLLDQANAEGRDLTKLNGMADDVAQFYAEAISIFLNKKA